MIIFVLPVNEADIVVPGGLKVKCSRCGEDCWEAPGTATFAAGGEIVCTRCIDGVLAERIGLMHRLLGWT